MPLRCLIVDDNASFLEASRNLLDGRTIIVVGVAATAAEGRRRCAELQPDVTLVDIDLGDDSGLDLARDLAGPADGVHSAVILVSAYPAEDFAELIADSGAVGFIAKPDLSAAAVQDVLRRSDRP